MVSLEIVGMTVLWTFLFGYLIVASIDFGAGFFSFYSHLSGQKHLIQPIIERYLSPMWEVTNVFLIFFIVGIVGFFPDTAYYYGTALLIPGSVAVILLAIRGSYYAFSHYGSKTNRLYLFMYGASGLLIPASLSTVLTISEGGFIEVDPATDRVTFLFEQLLLSSYSWSVVLLALVSVLYVSAMFLTYYAAKAGDRNALEVVRKYAIAWSVPTILSSLLVFYALHGHNAEHFAKMASSYAWMFVMSFLCFLGAICLVWTRRYYGVAFVLVGCQFAFAFYGYGASHLPYLLYPYLTLHDHFNNRVMAYALVAAFAAGLLLLIPSLWLLARLFLFDAGYVRGQSAKKG